MDEIVKELQAFDIEDPELLDVVMMVRSRALSDREALKELTQELYENPETKSYGLYLQAASLHESGAAWTPGQVEGALTRVNEALRLSPSEKRFQETRDSLEKIKKDLAAGKSSKEGPFIFNFGFSFDLN